MSLIILLCFLFFIFFIFIKVIGMYCVWMSCWISSLLHKCFASFSESDARGNQMANICLPRLSLIPARLVAKRSFTTPVLASLTSPSICWFFKNKSSKYSIKCYRSVRFYSHTHFLSLTHAYIHKCLSATFVVTVVVPLTHPLTASQALAREKQKKDLICHVAGKPR